MLRHALLASCLAAAALCASSPAPAAPPAGPLRPDYTAYQELLDEFLVVTSPKGAPLETRFDYSRLHDQPGRYERLKRIYSQFARVDPETLEPRERLAWAINTYNFLVIRIVTDNLIIPNARSRERVRWSSVRDITSHQGGFFARPAILLGDSTYSLDAFERKYVYAGFDRSSDTPPAALDPRAHFALVCGAVGCPPLQPRAYLPQTLDRQLDQAVRETLASPRHLEWKPEENLLRGSEIFSWYFRDFGGLEQAFTFAMKYAPPKVRAWAKQKNLRQFAFFVPWDWALNHTPPSGT